jgi:hypothetical protein
MKMTVIASTLLLVGCATTDDRKFTTGELEVMLSRERGAAHSSLKARLTNRSAGPHCLIADIVRNPGSHEVTLTLRDPRGRTVTEMNRGYPGDYQPEAVRLEPGEIRSTEYALQGRFARRTGDKGWSVQAHFRFGTCEKRKDC